MRKSTIHNVGCICYNDSCALIKILPIGDGDPVNAKFNHKNNQQHKSAWLIWSLGCLFYLYECLLQVSPGVMSSELMHDFAVTSQTLGVLSGIYFYSYACMQMPCGILMDRFGPHRLLTVAAFICAVSTIGFGMTDNFFAACVARLMIGFGSAFAVVGSLKLAANWFDAKRFAFLTGLMVTLGMLGAIGGEAPLALLIEWFGWRHSMIIMGCAGLIIASLILMFTKDSPYIIQAPIKRHKEPLIPRLLILLTNKQLWLVAIYGGLIYMATPVFCGLWGVPYLMLKMHISKALAANCISLVFIGWAIASPLWGVFSNRYGKRKPSMYVAAIGALFSSIFFIFVSMPTILVQLFLLIFGLCSAGFLPAFAVVKELSNKRYVATSVSFMNMVNMIGIAIAQPLIGLILDYFWRGEIVNAVRIYPIEAYQIALSIIPIGMLIALLLLPFIRETHCQMVSDA